MRIGLVTIYGVPNYGSVLQAYATQKVFELMGQECIILKYNHYKDQMRKSGTRYKSVLKSLVLDYIPFLKTAKLRKFRNKFFHFSKAFNSIAELKKNNWDDYDLFVVGSDQVWNTNFLNGNTAFLLSFVPNGKPRHSLSSSFALKHLPEEYLGLFRKELSQFSSLSVREQNGVDIIKRDLHIDKDVKVTLDPTLLIDRSQWLSLVKSKSETSKPYILVYLWTYAFEPRPYFERVVEHFQNNTGYEVRVLEGHRHLGDLKVPFVDDNRSSISEFIRLFDDASMVITSSFHGTAFAVNFGKPVISIVPDGASDDRQSTLLKSLQLSNCIVRIGDDISKITPYYDVVAEQLLLANLREDSLSWIRNRILE